MAEASLPCGQNYLVTKKLIKRKCNNSKRRDLDILHAFATTEIKNQCKLLKKRKKMNDFVLNSVSGTA